MRYEYKNDIDVDTINVVQFGLGHIGKNAVKEAMKKDIVTIVGAVDIDPDLIGKNLVEVLEISKNLNISVVKSIKDVFEQPPVDIVLHTTKSLVESMFYEFKEIMEGGANVVSTTEELLLLDLKNSQMAREFNAIAKMNNVTCLGTGITIRDSRWIRLLFVLQVCAMKLNTFMQNE